MFAEVDKEFTAFAGFSDRVHFPVTILRPAKAFVIFDPVDYAEFCQRAIPTVERLSIPADQWPSTERNCRRAYRAVRSILVTKDYIAAARASLPMFRHFKTLPPTLVNVLNFVSQEIYDPGWIKSLDENSLSE